MGKRKFWGMITLVLCLVLTMSFSVAGTTSVQTIADDDFMASQYYKGDHYTFKQINVGDTVQGRVLSQTGTENSNIDVYQLIVRESGMVSMYAEPLAFDYYRDLVIDGPMMLSDQSGQKKVYAAGAENAIAINDFNGYGCYQKSVYLEAGTYYFTVSGKAYSEPDKATNYLIPVPYQLQVTASAIAQDPNRDTDESAAYTFSGTSEQVQGGIGMLMNYSASSNQFRTDTKDRYYVPAGNVGNVQIKVTNNNVSALSVFNKEKIYTRGDSPDKLELNRLGTSFIQDKALRVSLQGVGQVKLLPGESYTYSLDAEDDTSYTLECFASIPASYTLNYTDARPEDMTAPETSEPESNEPENEEPEEPEETQPSTDQNTESDDPATDDPTESTPGTPADTTEGTDEIPLYITLIVIDESTGDLAQLTNVTVNGVSCAIADNLVTSQLVPHRNGRFEIEVEAVGHTRQTFDEPVQYDGLNMVHLSLPVEAAVPAPAPAPVPETTKSVKPIIMVHTACDIPASVFDAHNYDIFVNGVNYNDQEGYMGHITDLPVSEVGTVYDVEIRVDGYLPYKETITIPDSEYEDGNAVVFVNVNTSKDNRAPSEPQTYDDVTDIAIDTASDWAKALITEASEAGLKTKAMSQTDFKAEASREAFCELVMKLYENLGGTMDSQYNPFTDTNNPAVINAYNAGIIGGTSLTTFSPNASITREQLCVMILKALKAADISVNTQGSYQMAYTDLDSITNWATESVRTLNSYGIINGSGDSLNPLGTVSKEMAVIMIYKAYDVFQ
ncbi:S-layer homology domain-containing protein [Fusibacter paucivorans]|uniref:S-layer homology domain-containing protein n=1 Tax=Fusibacter paucivorans TaxID=76009 RepID=A0ABS5PLF6_9FIRM|nr:S-layer homology domain-containing protein [Fusibacter paucivorans]MBS7525998.1 S-layer homology domain-containing protein [Fusibacter paucivorans]